MTAKWNIFPKTMNGGKRKMSWLTLTEVNNRTWTWQGSDCSHTMCNEKYSETVINKFNLMLKRLRKPTSPMKGIYFIVADVLRNWLYQDIYYEGHRSLLWLSLLNKTRHILKPGVHNIDISFLVIQLSWPVDCRVSMLK